MEEEGVADGEGGGGGSGLGDNEAGSPLIAQVLVVTNVERIARTDLLGSVG